MDITTQINNWATIISESELYDKAKKIGYLGDKNDEERIADWLKTDYAKWKQHALDVFTRIANGDEEKVYEWFKVYNKLASCMVGTAFGSEHGYIPSEKIKENLEKELGDDPEVKELMKKIDDKWEADRKSLRAFYDTSKSRGGWTGD